MEIMWLQIVRKIESLTFTRQRLANYFVFSAEFYPFSLDDVIKASTLCMKNKCGEKNPRFKNQTVPSFINNYILAKYLPAIS